MIREPIDPKHPGIGPEGLVATVKDSGGVHKLPLDALLDGNSFDAICLPDPTNEHEARQVDILSNHVRVSPALARVFERQVNDSAILRTVFVPLPLKR